MNEGISPLHDAVVAAQNGGFAFGEESAYPSFQAFMIDAYDEVVELAELAPKDNYAFIDKIIQIFSALNVESNNKELLDQLGLLKTLLFFYFFVLKSEKNENPDETVIKSLISALPDETALSEAFRSQLSMEYEVSSVVGEGIVLRRTIIESLQGKAS